MTPTVMDEMVAMPMLESRTDLAKLRSSTTVAWTMLAEDPPKTLILLSKNLSSSSLDTAPKNSSSLLSTGSGLAALLIGLMALSGSLVSLIALVASVGGWGKFSSGLNLLLILVLSDAEEDDRLLCSVVVWPVTETTGVPPVGVTPNPPGPGVDIEAGFLVG